MAMHIMSVLFFHANKHVCIQIGHVHALRQRCTGPLQQHFAGTLCAEVLTALLAWHPALYPDCVIIFTDTCKSVSYCMHMHTLYVFLKYS